jgi:isoleucyl-tRNA synthetase
MVPRERMLEVDRFALARYAAVATSVRRAYASYDFQTIFHAVNELVTVDISALFADIAKDRLYTFRADSHERRSAQTALYVLADGLTRLMAPILSVTTEEIWQALPGSHEASVHLAEFPIGTEEWLDSELEARWSRLLEIRAVVNAALEAARQKKAIGNALSASVTITASGADADLLVRHEPDLPMFFITSGVAIRRAAAGGVSVEVTPAPGEKCPRCWRFVTETVGEGEFAGLCTRCAGALGRHQ